MHWARIIRIDDEHQSEVLATFDGDSVGRWEGDTLVVETINFMDQLTSCPATSCRAIFARARRRLIYGFTVEDADYADSYGGEMVWPKSDQVPTNMRVTKVIMQCSTNGARVREAEHRAANGSDD